MLRLLIPSTRTHHVGAADVAGKPAAQDEVFGWTAIIVGLCHGAIVPIAAECMLRLWGRLAKQFHALVWLTELD